MCHEFAGQHAGSVRANYFVQFIYYLTIKINVELYLTFSICLLYQVIEYMFV